MYTKLAWVCCACACMAAPRVSAGENAENKNVTIISAQSSADGKSQIAKEIVEECIVSLPSPAKLEAVTEAKTEYLRHINGKEDDNRHMKTYRATVEIHYLVRQKELIIITTSSVTGQEPVLKEVERMVRESATIRSDPNEGDVFANRSPREYFFSSPEKAAASAKKRAHVWLNNHTHAVCPQP
ncbi:MAG: hypothetical protein GF418_07395 [Chitinivibrionales bacterium]|nr:hypothetical protein [Chitinivibrionales bacterium]MBD3395436.1 hypothetical protein [Chitinivibrionales bacterium]